ncbi:MAG: GAF domain-containing protein [Chloroflexota bacterium]
MIVEPLQVLVIEDSPNDAELIIYELTRAGYTVDWKRVTTQEDYVAALGPDLDLILADYNLPQFTALQALHLLQSTSLDIPFIVVTGSIEEVAIECMKRGAEDYLLKDRLGRLPQAVERALEQRSLREEKRRTDAALQRHNAQLEALYKTSLEINAQPDLPSLLETIVTQAVGLLDAPIGGLYLVRPDGRSLELVVNHNLPDDYLGTVLRLGEGLSGRVAQSGKMLMVDDYYNWEGRAPVYREAFLRALAVPLKLGMRVLGVIKIADDRFAGAFTDEQVRLAELFADQAAIAVENARLLDISQRELRERQRAQKALQESQRALATLMSNLPGMAYRCVYKPVWMMKFVSDGCLALTGYQPVDLIENRLISYENIVHPEDISRLRHEIDTALRTDRPYQVIYRIVTATGAVRWVWEQGRGIFGAEESDIKTDIRTVPPGLPDDFDPSATAVLSVSQLLPSANPSLPKKLQALEGFITDITSRIQAEDALRNNEELFRQLAENVHDIFWVIEANTGKLIYISPVYETVSGRSRWPLYQSLLPLMRAIYREDFRRVRQALNRYAHGLSVHGQYRIVRPDGGIRWVDVRTYPIYNVSQQVYRWVGVAQDITESKLAEEQLRQQADRLQALDVLSRSLAGTLQDYHAALDVVVHQVVEFLGGACCIALQSDADENLHAVAVDHVNVDTAAELRRLVSSISMRDVLPKEVVVDGEALFVPHVDRKILQPFIRPAYKRYLERYGLSSLMAVALHAQGHVIGAMLVFRDKGMPGYTGEDLSFLQELANRIALTVTNSRLYAENLRRLEYLQALREIDIAISGSVDLKISLKVILENAVTQLGVDAASVLTFDPYMQILEYLVGQGFRTRAAEQAKVPLGSSLAGRAVLENRAVSIPDWTATSEVANTAPELAALLRAEGFVAYFARPLVAKGQVQGVLEAFHRSRFEPKKEWLNFFDSLAGQAAIAINNADLLMNLQRTNTELTLAYNETIQGWSRALDLRDRETEGHTQRVAEMTERLARAMGISGERLAHIRRGALLHDIGKMGVRDQILLKPGKLTDEEWVEMRKHPVYAYSMLAPIAYLRPAIDIPYCHHEWWDGSGYPRGLKGDEIPLEARIFAIADVWDAMVYPRVYHPDGISPQEALMTIRSLSGTQFDPAVVEKFFEVFGGEMGLGEA